MGTLIFNTDDEGRAKLKAMFVALGGDEKEWDEKMRRLDNQIESTGEISRIMKEKPHWGKRRPG